MVMLLIRMSDTIIYGFSAIEASCWVITFLFLCIILNASMNFGAVRDFFVEFVLLGFCIAFLSFHDFKE